MKLVLYSTSHCHLCEQAEALLAQLGVEAEHIDIVDDDALLERYGTCIPVVKRADNGSEIGWPFDIASLRSFIA
ncbi:MAG: glutaredoxin family protein [Sideroxydans sp.]|nr:glutaredoxin family protein [Sideroxydans sp.]